MEQSVNNGGKPFFGSAVEFSQFIETRAKNDKSTVLEALVAFIEEHEIEPEKIKSLVSDSLRNKLKTDFIELGMLKKESSLSEMFS